MAEAVKAMARALNFTIDWVARSPGEWGTLENGTWSGVIGDLVYDRASFTSTALYYYPDRAKVVDYGLGVFEDDITIGISPDYGLTTRKLDTKAYLTVFKGLVWLSLLFLSLFSGLTLMLSRQYSANASDRTQLNTWYWRFSHGLVEYLATLGERSLIRSKSRSFEWMMFLIQFCSIMVFAVYSSALTAHVTSKETMVKPKSFQEMLDLGIRVSNTSLLIQVPARPEKASYKSYRVRQKSS